MGGISFKAKLNKRPDGSNYTIEESVILVDGKFEGLLTHDNIGNSTVKVYTGSNFTGDEITNFVVSIPSNAPWRRSIRVYAEVPKVYVTYQTPGDQVDADDINYIQDVILESEASLSNALLLKADKDITYTKTETDERIKNIIGSAPEALDTLVEIAEALNNDPNFAATITLQLSSKVEKIAGKSLSTEDYSTAEKAKLAGISFGANNYIHPSTHPPTIIVQDEGNRFVTDAEKATWNAKETIEGSQAKVTAVQTSLTTHSNDAVKHITAAERTAWNAKETTEGSQAKATAVQISLTTHANDAVKHITAAERTTWNAKETTEGSQAKATVVQTSLTTHANDEVKHITAAERKAWNEKETISGSQIKVDAHANRTDNPHAVTKTQIGLPNVNNYDISTQVEAEGGTSNVKYMTPLRTAQAIQKQISGLGGGDMLKSVYDSNNNGKVDQSETADSIPWAGVSGKPTTFSPAAHEHSLLQRTDDRDRKPIDTAKGSVEFVFTSLNGMTGATGGTYQDMLVLNAYTDASGGKVNALVLDKSTMTIRHYQAEQNATSWGNARVLAYTDEVLSKGPITWGQLRGDL
ncbi:MAG: hypothetical protein NAG76_22920 [Candidatus Pristimantibacillus lignocellulolyticus]|uniref:BppU N-terminal domain-containing protein n=1 Tax=Candidatus Pristimantibacillus lignocellulolyticus TaxID=2994561 RepID=A0A9J6ZFT2_9BACL|nr:MAG: hypothetical protein NAG76_22920 [Candidatus Pristimantibacillus lignocellulolyticus]